MVKKLLVVILAMFFGLHIQAKNKKLSDKEQREQAIEMIKQYCPDLGGQMEKEINSAERNIFKGMKAMMNPGYICHKEELVESLQGCMETHKSLVDKIAEIMSDKYSDCLLDRVVNDVETCEKFIKSTARRMPGIAANVFAGAFPAAILSTIAIVTDTCK